MKKKTIKIYFKSLVFLFFVILSGCTTISPRVPPPPSRPPEVRPDVPPPVIRKDIVHTVGPGETLWRIGKMYDVGVGQIVLANKLLDPVRIETGQRLLVPKAAPIKPVVYLYPSDKWQYIIIHHSATDQGNALMFDRAHNLRGFTRGLGYHFVIDNGTKGKIDGQIEQSPRWLKQQNGAHCKAAGMNNKGIGICLVGNFNNEKVTSKQMESLVYLVNKIRHYYDIPLTRIQGHGQVKGAQTDCPGTRFPWAEFWRRIRE
jgi:N-acetylmuramoyl-L-alanine amidase